MRLGAMIRVWRAASAISIREAAKQIGVLPATLSRIERGLPMDGKALSLVLAWIMGKA